MAGGELPRLGPLDDDDSDRGAVGSNHRDAEQTPPLGLDRHVLRSTPRRPEGPGSAPRLGPGSPAPTPAPGSAASGTRRAAPRAPRGADRDAPPDGEGPHQTDTGRRCGRRTVAPRSRTIVVNTGWTSVGELLMTRRISLVAVCCSSASVRSRVLGLQLGEQPRVLDGDRRLVGEGLHQGDLALGERPDLVAVDHDDAEQLARPEAWGQTASVRTGSMSPRPVGVLRVAPGIVYVDAAPLEGGARRDGVPRPGAMGCCSTNALSSGLDVVGRDDPIESDHRSGGRTLARLRTAGARSRPASRSTGCRSNVDRPITLSSSLVAVCCSSATRSSRIARLQLLEQARRSRSR